MVLVASLGSCGGCKETSSWAGLLRERKLGRELTTCTGEERGLNRKIVQDRMGLSRHYRVSRFLGSRNT